MNPAQFPEKLAFLFQPHRYKVAYGGRGSGKSWGFARALLLTGLSEQIRVLCARETQRSISESVHRLLRDQIELLDLGDFYQVLNTEIRGKNGTAFFFTGLADHTVDSLKSFEGVSHCWIEEGHTITEHSWRILIPTIRAEGSEIWISFNPQLETDPTYKRFVLSPPPDCITRQVNWSDNPWFHQTTMPAEMEYAKRTMTEEEFAHVWEGACMPAVEGAIYHRAMTQMNKDGRITRVPHDPMLKTHVVVDLGFNDAMSIGLVQKASSEVRIIHYIEDRQRTLTDYSRELKELTFNGEKPQWGTMFLPHDGFAKRHQTGRADYDVLTALGWDVHPEPVTQMSVRAGIQQTQQMFPQLYIDNGKPCARLVECLKRYRYNINQRTGEAQTPLHDEFSHGADMVRYLALAVDNMTNEDDFYAPIQYPKRRYA